MESRVVSGIMLSLLLIGMLTMAFNIQFVGASKPLGPNGVQNMATYESRIGEQGLLFEDENIQMWVPATYETHSGIIFDYLKAGYGNLSSIFGDHDYPYKFSVEHYPEGSPYGWGGTDARGTIRYGYGNLEDNTPEWNIYGVPHVIGYYEEMAHCFVRDFGVRGEVSVGFYETLGMMIGGETTLRAAYNPYIEARIEDDRQMINETTIYYLEHDNGPPGVPENIWLTRVLAHIFKTEVIDVNGWDTLSEVFKNMRDSYPLRKYDRDHTWGGFLHYLGEVAATDLHAVFGNYGLPMLTWTGEPGYERDGVEKIGYTTYRFRVKCLDREGKQPENVKLHLYNEEPVLGSPLEMLFVGGGNEEGWIYEVEVDISIPEWYAFSADDGAHSIFQAVGLPTLVHDIELEPRTWYVDDNGGVDFASIQDAISSDLVVDGDTIFVYTGTYYENVVVDKSLSLIGENRSNTIIDGNFSETVMKITANDVNITGFTIQNSGTSTFYEDSGIFISSSGNNISYNTLTNNLNGFFCYTSSNNHISWNKIVNNELAVRLSWSSNNILTGNNITNNERGIHFYFSSNNVFKSNHFIGNEYTSRIDGNRLSDFVNDVDASNTVNGKPVYYWVNMRELVVPLDAGYVALVNCTNITVQDLNLTKNGQGVLLAYTTDSTIVKNRIANNDRGIHLVFSANNSIWKNNIANNDYMGVELDNSSNNVVSGNDITKNEHGVELHRSSNNNIIGNDIAVSSSWGIQLFSSSYNTVSENNITANNKGVSLFGGAFNNTICRNNITNNWAGFSFAASSNNSIHHNNIINNTIQAYGPSSENVWDNGIEGNYWSDYEGVDTNGDGIGDTAYVIDENNQDNYPLMEPWSPRPPSPQEALEELIQTVESWNLDEGIETSLTSKLQAAYRSSERENQKASLGQIKAFINHLEALRGKKLTNEQADQLISEAQRIIDLIEG